MLYIQIKIDYFRKYPPTPNNPLNYCLKAKIQGFDFPTQTTQDTNQLYH